MGTDDKGEDGKGVKVSELRAAAARLHEVKPTADTGPEQKTARTPRTATEWEARLVAYAVTREGLDDVAGFAEVSPKSVLRLTKGEKTMNVGTIGAVVRHAYDYALEQGVSPSTILPGTEARLPTAAEIRVVERAVAKTDGGYQGLAHSCLVSHETIRRTMLGQKLYGSSIAAVVTAAEVVLGIDPGTGIQGKAAAAKPPTRVRAAASTPTGVDDTKLSQLRAFCTGLGLTPGQIHAIERALGAGS